MVLQRGVRCWRPSLQLRRASTGGILLVRIKQLGSVLYKVDLGAQQVTFSPWDQEKFHVDDTPMYKTLLGIYAYFFQFQSPSTTIPPSSL